MGSQRVRHDWVTKHSTAFCYILACLCICLSCIRSLRFLDLWAYKLYHTWKFSHYDFEYFLCLPSLSASSRRWILCISDYVSCLTVHRGFLNSLFFLSCFIWFDSTAVLKFTYIFIRQHLMAPHSSTLAWKIPWTEEPGRLQSMGSLRVGHDWATSLSLFTFMHWKRKWQPTPVFLPGESQGRGNLVGCHLRGRTESDTTEAT